MTAPDPQPPVPDSRLPTPDPQPPAPDSRKRARWWVRVLRTLGLVVVVYFVLTFLLVMFFENSFIYFPTKYPEGDWKAPARMQNKVEEVEFEASDGVKIHGWFVKGDGAKHTLLFFHGNAGNLSDRADWVDTLASLPTDILAIDYRGYGKSEGKPNEEGVYRDAMAAYQWLTETRKIPANKIILYGKSLGGAPACELASRVPCGGLILQSTFTNAKDMAGTMMPLLPVKWFMRHRFDNLGKIAKIEIPKLIVHSRNDEIIPYAMAERLHEAAKEPKSLVTYDGAGHNDLIFHFQSDLLDRFRAFLDTLPH